MKKILLTSTLIFLSLILFAQGYKTTIGFKISPGISTIYDEDFGVSNSRFSIFGGVEIRHQLFRDLIYLETGIYLLEGGRKGRFFTLDNVTGTVIERTTKEVRNYLTIPISAIVKQDGLYFGTGPTINYYLSRKFFIDGELINNINEPDESDILFGMQLLMGYEFKVKDNLLIALETFANPIFSQKSLNYGLGIGLKYSLKNKISD